MDFKQLLENKPLLYTIIGVIVVVFGLFLTMGVVHSSGGQNAGKEKVIKKELDLLTTDNLGKALEIQSLLAQQGIDAERKLDGTKSTIYLVEYTQSQRDIALLTIVKSGLVDQNVGLEIFDKGDFTSTKEDKRIRLARAINGELARLIRKMGGIDDASVFVSIPEQSMFTEMQKPVTATVQVTIPVGERLDDLKVKAIKNLLIGSVSGLTIDNVSITDTNGNVYNSVIGDQDQMVQRSEENDKYMQQKVNTQLDKLIGKGNYVATVSTSLRQSPIETSSINYDPKRKASINEQTFVEGLGDNSQGATSNPGGAVSISLPNGLPGNIGGAGSTSQSKNYERSARETQYGVSKTQINEYTKAGAIEQVSVAVTIDKSAIPPDTTIEELKDLIAGAAGPKVNPANVTVAFAESLDPYLASDKTANLPAPAETGNPWWLAIAALVVGIGGGLKYLSNKLKKDQERQKTEIERLEEKTQRQDLQIQDFNLKAAELIEKQNQMAQGLIEQKQRDVIPTPQPAASNMEIDRTISDIKTDLEGIDEDEVGEKIKSWIERG